MIKICSAKTFAQAYSTVLDYTSFEENLLGVLNKHAPLKNKVKNKAIYYKALRKATIKRSYLEKIYFKKNTTESLKKYKKQEFL